MRQIVSARGWRLLLLWTMAMLVGVCPVSGVTGATSQLRLAATTTIDNSGLLQHLLAAFEARFEARVRVITAGTGRVLKIAANGDVDVVFVHAPNAEAEFVQAGFGVRRQTVMVNDFILIGPSHDPADVRGQSTAAQALLSIATHQAAFVSRGDNSGTHKKEQLVWQQAELKPQGQTWYFEVGQGMGATLQIADNKQAYTLVDRGTYLSYRGTLELGIVHEGDPVYVNPYSVIAVNPQRHPHVNYKLATAFIDWLISAEGQQRIGSYQKHGQVLFRPYGVRKLH